MSGPLRETKHLRVAFTGVTVAVLFAAALLALYPVKASVETNASYSCGVPLASPLGPGAKTHWGADTIRTKAAHPEAVIARLPDTICPRVTSRRLRLALAAGVLGGLLLFGGLAQRARMETRRQRRAPAERAEATGGHHAVARRFAHVDALDGMRGLAVLAVLAFHAGLSWAQGGFLGVDAFFVLSGYLITSLLVNEWEGRGSIALGAFWSRRARRLLPALLLVLLAIALYGRYVTDPTRIAALRIDAMATLLYVANWRFIYTHVGYFDVTAPASPLRHMWSLAVEEQFYVLWPPIVLVILTTLRSRRALFWIASGCAAVSAVAMVILYSPSADPTRVYYGTDTRAQTVLIGAALAALGPDLTWAATQVRRRVLLTIGVISALFVAWTWVAVDGGSSFLYRGGLTVIALAVAAVIAVAVATTSVLGRLLSWKPLTAVGRISYGLYLWHWPVFLVITRTRTGLWGFELLALRLVVTFALALLSFVLVERPIRRGAFRHGWAAVATPLALGATVLALLVTTVPKTTLGQFSNLAAKPESPRDVHVLALGDSVALTLFGHDEPPGVWLEGGARLGCGILRGTVRARGTVGTSCRSDPIEGWRVLVDRTRPDTVALLIGRWEVHDRRIGGRWTHVGDPEFDASLIRLLDRGIKTLASRGAHVVLMTTPYFNGLERPDGGRWPEDEPVRVDRFNRLLRTAAADQRRQGMPVSVYDFGKVLAPEGHFSRTVDGVTARTSDDIHITGDGAKLVARTLYPTLIEAGQARRALRLARSSSS